MAKVTTKFQVTVPKTVVRHYGIRPGDDIEWIPAGDVIRVVPPGSRGTEPDTGVRLRWFDQATARQRRRQRRRPAARRVSNRGWKREDLYTRARPR